MRYSIPMTPRSISTSTASSNFSRQLAEYKARNGDGAPPPSKKFKSSYAPKGSRLASGYVDRAALRKEEEDGQAATLESGPDDDKKMRLKALEEMMYLGQIDKATFLNLRKELGFQGEYDGGSRPKGLDFELLERTRRAEPNADEVLADDHTNDGKQGLTPVDRDEDFEAVLDAKAQEEVAPIQKDAQIKKGILAAPRPLSSSEVQKLSRDEILRRLKASRKAGHSGQDRENTTDLAQESALGTKYKKIGVEKKRWIETDESGRRKEILLTTDKNGKPKRKVRWLDKEAPVAPTSVDKQPITKTSDVKQNSNVLGMEVPAEILARQKALQENEPRNDDNDDDDIFAGVGSNYNPLGNIPSDDEDSDASGPEEGETPSGQDVPRRTLSGDQGQSTKPTQPRNYFATSTSQSNTTKEASDKDHHNTNPNPLSSDPTILAALKRAASLRQAQEQSSSSDPTSADPESSSRQQKLLETLRKREREDNADLDFGFGDTRFGDDDDEDDEQMVWDDEEGGTAAGEKKSSGRKRGPKKRKGNKDSLQDVMGVLEGRKKDK